MSDIPRPGSPVRGSDTGRPIMALLDLLGRRWALRVIWELRDGPHSFRALQAGCGGISSSVLNDRLAELRAAGVLEAGADGYALTEEGRELLELYGPLDAWAQRWAARERRPGPPARERRAGPSTRERRPGPPARERRAR